MFTIDRLRSMRLIPKRTRTIQSREKKERQQVQHGQVPGLDFQQTASAFLFCRACKHHSAKDHDSLVRKLLCDRLGKEITHDILTKVHKHEAPPRSARFCMSIPSPVLQHTGIADVTPCEEFRQHPSRCIPDPAEHQVV